jgi:hypothetical protein
MKVKALINCIGIGYEFNKGEVKDLKKETAELLLKFKYVEEIKTSKKAVK